MQQNKRQKPTPKLALTAIPLEKKTQTLCVKLADRELNFAVYELVKDARLIVCRDPFLAPSDAAAVKTFLQSIEPADATEPQQSVRWQRVPIKVFGKQAYLGPQSLWFNGSDAAPGLEYSFTGSTWQPQPLPAAFDCVFRLMSELAAKEAAFGGVDFGADPGVWANVYASNKGLGMHQDNESRIVKGSDIGSLSFGATRTFLITDKQTFKYSIPLGENSFCIMAGKAFQTSLWHGVQEEKPSAVCKPRFNLTIRHYRK